MSAIYKVSEVIERYNTTLAEYSVVQENEVSIVAEETFEGESISLVAGIGKTIANLTGTYFISVISSSTTAIMSITVGAQTLSFKRSILTQLTGSSIFIDANIDCTITFKAYKLS